MADDACFVCFPLGRCDLDGAAKAHRNHANALLHGQLHQHHGE